MKHLLPRLLCTPIIILALSLPGCGLTAALFGPPTTSLKSVQINSLPDANQNTPATVDVVFIYDNSALALLPNTATDWFANRLALQNTLGGNIDVASQEVPPASQVNVVMPARHGKALKVRSYVAYVSGNQAAADLTLFRKVQIELQPASVAYSNQ
ncbi:hypothetical protein IGB42_00376 [Andreprevotia sp. IGB-42]|uniref:hypothetical protein n=1 Tax=Andreprevotia sp. IGB-42 TaxID=2497473 RepID=UPI00135AC7BE|nr:hypothetical protein [Andreprevotia sp. IGB-42]KAF0815295.1 hypothetical protein IGB42_00376 [Andreprevotia sp. IGB-42]